MEKKTFNKGDFIKYTAYSGNNNVTFGIFEGVDLAPEFQYTKKYSLVLYYDSHKYCSNGGENGGWGYKAVLDIGKDGKQCEKTIDTMEEDSWWSLCTPTEKREAIETLASYGYEWNEELMALVDVESGEIVHKIIIPKIEYHGDTIKPIGHDLKNKLKKSVLAKNKTTSAAHNPYAYNMYGTGYGDYENEIWD